MKRLTRDKKVYFLDPNNPPAIKVKSGEELIVETWDAFEGTRDVAAIQAKPFVAPATGPIYVEGAEPGDALKVEFLSIKPVFDAAHMVMPGRGFLTEMFDKGYPTTMALDGDHVVLPNGIRVKMMPSMGFVANTPTYRQTTASDSGPYGGDVDMKELVAGSTFWVPVFVPGGMLTMGDCHAVIGDGAVGGTGAECSSETHIRVSVEKGMNLTTTRALTPEHFVILSYGEELAPAMKEAVHGMVKFLIDEKKMKPYEAYTLMSMAGDVRISRTFRPISPVKMMLSRKVLDQIG